MKDNKSTNPKEPQNSTLTDKYIDIFTDFGFKKIFGEECNKELLLDFLNEVLQKKGEKIVSLTYLKNEKFASSEESRKAIYDLYCENDKGEKFIVELQNSAQTYFKERCLYYSTFAITDQAIKGKDWDFELKAVYVVCILNFIMSGKRIIPGKFKSDVMLMDVETKEIFYDKLKYVFLEMPLFPKTLDELETRYEKWMYVLKNLKRLDRIPEELRDRIFEKMFTAAEIAKLTPEEYLAYVDSLNSYRDYNNALKYAENKGKNEGLAEGEKIKSIEIAKKLKKDNMPTELIIKYTNLTIEEIENL